MDPFEFFFSFYGLLLGFSVAELVGGFAGLVQNRRKVRFGHLTLLLAVFVAIDIDRGFWTVAMAHTTVTLCFVTVIVQSRLLTFDRSLEEAAMDLGCPPLRTFLTVTLPLIFPAIAAGWMLAFTLSLDDLVIASFTTGPGATTLPLRIYSEVRLGVKPEINAICTIMIAVRPSSFARLPIYVVHART